MDAQEKLEAIKNALIRVKAQESSLADDAPSAGVSAGASALGVVAGIGSLAGSLALGYHGYKRNNDSIGWGAGWFLLGGFFPLGTAIGGVLALDQGFAKPIAQAAPAQA
jgi:hypothetical protein